MPPKKRNPAPAPEPATETLGLRVAPKAEAEEVRREAMAGAGERREPERRFTFTYRCSRCKSAMTELDRAEKEELKQRFGIEINVEREVYLCENCKVLVEP